MNFNYNESKRHSEMLLRQAENYRLAKLARQSRTPSPRFNIRPNNLSRAARDLWERFADAAATHPVQENRLSPQVK